MEEGKKLSRKEMLSLAETGPNETARTPHLPLQHIKVNGTTPASPMGLPGQTPPRPPGFSSAGASSSLTRAGGCPSARRPPEQRLGGGEKWAWLASIGCAGRRGGGKTLSPGDTRARAHLRCAAAPVRPGSAPQITADGFACAQRRTSGAREEVSAARAAPRAPERGWGGGRVPARRSVTVRDAAREPRQRGGEPGMRGALEGCSPLPGASLLPAWGDLGSQGSALSGAVSQSLPGSQRCGPFLDTLNPPTSRPAASLQPRAASAAWLSRFSR